MKDSQTKEELFWEICRFLLVGGTATLVDYFVFWIFDGVVFPSFGSGRGWQTVSLALATALGFSAGLIVNWLLSVRFVFKKVQDERAVRSKKSFLVFTLIGLVGLLITEVGVLFLVWVFPEFPLFGRTAILGTTWAKWLAKGIMTCVVLGWNYVGRKFFIFH